MAGPAAEAPSGNTRRTPAGRASVDDDTAARERLEEVRVLRDEVAVARRVERAVAAAAHERVRGAACRLRSGVGPGRGGERRQLTGQSA